jgi:hypothetical protein
MKKIILVLMIVGSFRTSTFSQSYNAEKTALSNFIVRMYKSEPFTGVKVFLDYENKYLISLVKLSASSNSSESAMNRVAEVKAKAQVNQFLNGSYISVESIVTTTATTSSATPCILLGLLFSIASRGAIIMARPSEREQNMRG